MSITLYDYWRSSAAYRLRITMNLMGLAYDQIPVDLTSGAQRADDNMARNVQGLVPTLEIDSHSLTQSLAIIEYLDETRHFGLLPRTALGRARVRRISHSIAMEMHPVCNLRVAKYAVEHSDGAITMKSWMHGHLPDGIRAVEAMLSEPQTGRFCHGDTISMADICLVPQMYNIKRWEIDLSACPNVNRIMTELEAIPAVAAAHPDNHQPED